MSAVRPVATVLLTTASAGCTGAATPVDAVGEAAGALLIAACVGCTGVAALVDVAKGLGVPNLLGDVRRHGCLYMPMGDVRCTCMHKSCSRNRSG